MIWRALRPASTSRVVDSVSISVQLPALPVPKIVTSIPTTGIVRRAGRDSSGMEMKDGDFGPAVEADGRVDDADAAIDVHARVAALE